MVADGHPAREAAKLLDEFPLSSRPCLAGGVKGLRPVCPGPIRFVGGSAPVCCITGGRSRCFLFKRGGRALSLKPGSSAYKSCSAAAPGLCRGPGPAAPRAAVIKYYTTKLPACIPFAARGGESFLSSALCTDLIFQTTSCPTPQNMVYFSYHKWETHTGGPGTVSLPGIPPPYRSGPSPVSFPAFGGNPSVFHTFSLGKETSGKL